MPYLWPIKGKTKQRDMISGFLGYNHNLRIRENELYDMRNMTSDALPVTGARARRGCVRQLGSPNGLFAHDKLCWVEGTSFYYDGAVKGTVTDTEKKFVRMGAYVLIWPDKKYYNAVEDEFGSLGASYASVAGNTVTAVLCRADGEGYTYTAADTAPEDPADGDYWIDTSETQHWLKVYSESYGTWNTIATVYVKISAAGIDDNFANDDGVTISGMDDDALNGSFVIVDSGEDYIIVTAVIAENVEQTTAISVAREIPDMDYITECQNRVWGCTSANHEIYACKLGDPKNWNCFAGISTDSYAASVGSGGNFTGAVTHMGYVLFMKENKIHKMYGTQPSNFTMSEDAVRGVAEGSERSMAVINETLFYHSKSGVNAYRMALPETISSQLGVDAYQNAVCGAYVNKYYLNAQNADGVYEMIVYDMETGVWMKEDAIQALYMAELGSDLYFVDSDGYLWSVKGNITDYAEAEPDEGEPPYLEPVFTWMLETGDVGLDLPDYKYISGVHLMVAAASGAEMTIYMQFDENGLWTKIKTFAKLPVKNMTNVPFVTPRCHSLRIRIEGSGDIKLYGITKTVETGSDMRA